MAKGEDLQKDSHDAEEVLAHFLSSYIQYHCTSVDGGRALQMVSLLKTRADARYTFKPALHVWYSKHHNMQHIDLIHER